MTQDTISDLLDRIARQDRAALRALYGLSAPKLTGVLLRILTDRAEAEDALQEVFIRVWTRAAQFDASKGQGLTWLVAIARNHALDRLRSRPERRGQRRVEAWGEDGQDPLDSLPDPAAGAEAKVIQRAEMGRVMDCFAELPKDRATAVKGAYLQGLSYQDLADRLDVPLNTVRTWLRRSLISLRECLER